jgi:hypothetical protein
VSSSSEPLDQPRSKSPKHLEILLVQSNPTDTLLTMVQPLDPNDVVAYDTLSDDERLVAIRLILRSGEVRVLEGDALTDEVRQWLQEWEKARSKPPARQNNPDTTSNRKSG